MKKFRFLSAILALLMLCSVGGFTSTSALANPITPREKLSIALDTATYGTVATGGTYKEGVIYALEDATHEARLVFADEEATDEEINTVLNKLELAIINCETVSIYSQALWNAFEYADTLNPDDYTEESFQALLEAKGHKSDFYYCDDQKKIDKTVENINNAINGLVPVGDATVPVETAKDEFIRIFNRAFYYNNEYDGFFTKASKEKLHSAYIQAEALLDSDDVSDPQYNDASLKLQEAIDGLKEFSLNTLDFELALFRAGYYYEREYLFTEASYESFERAYYDQRFLLSESPFQYEVDSAIEKIYDAIEGLVPQDRRDSYQMEQDKFKKLYRDAHQYLELGSLYYSEDSLSTLLDAINSTNKYTHSNYEKHIYVSASNLLQSAIDGLQPPELDRIELEKLLDVCQKISYEDYTAESFAPFDAAFREAAVVFNSATTQEEIDSVQEKLSAAFDALVPVNEPAVTDSTNATEATKSTEATEATATTVATEPTSSTFDEPEESTALPVHTETVPETSTEAVEVTSSEVKDTTPTETVNVKSSYILGDADENLKVNIKDATALQKHIAKLTELSQVGCMAGDTTEDGKLNIKDATEIQKYIANLPSNENIGKEIETEEAPAETTVIPQTTETVAETSAEEKSEVISTATEIATADETEATFATEGTDPIETAPVATFSTESTDATEATAKAEENTSTVTEANTETTVETTIAETTTESVPETTANIQETTETLPAKDEITLYFTNSQNWENVNIHYWNENSSYTDWPGVPMEFVEANPYGQDVYKLAVPADIAGVVFNEGYEKAQTQDILGPFETNYGFYPEELADNKWNVGTYVYDDKSEIDFKVVMDERIYEGYGSEQTMFFVVNDSSDTAYKNYLTGEAPELDTDSLAERGKTLIVMLTYIGSGSNTQVIDKVKKDGTTLIVTRKVRTTLIGTADMNYRLVAIEVNSSDIEGITNFKDAEIFDVEY